MAGLASSWEEVSAPAPPTANVTPSGQPFDPLLHTTRWDTLTLTFSFPTSGSFYEPGYSVYNEPSQFSALNTTQMNAARTLLSQISQFTNLNFTEMTETSTAHADMRFAETTVGQVPTAVGYYPASTNAGGDTWYRSGNYENPILGSYAYNEGFMHEIGHALGLRHGHDVNPFGTLAANRDSNEFTVMTYRDHVGDATNDGSENEEWGNPQSYMMYDIAALQYMYGADFSAAGNVWSGDSVYTFSTTTGEMFINGAGQGTPGGNRIFRTIWDGHGTDTYDLSNYATNQTIDLRAGEWSTFNVNQLADLDGGSRANNLARGNVANALLYNGDVRSLIENAIGGSGADTLMGNQADNVLDGGSGNDTLYGNSGNDVLIGGRGNDILQGDTGFDAANYITSTSGVVVSIYGGTASDGLGFTDTLIGIENVVGSYYGDVIAGDNGDNTIYALDGNDGIYAGYGNDAVYAGAGSDSLFGSSGYDILDGGDGFDSISYWDSTTSIYVELWNGAAWSDGFGTSDGIANVEAVYGSSFADVISGDAGDNYLVGEGGGDWLYGGLGNDYLVAGAGSDYLVGNEGYDSFVFSATEFGSNVWDIVDDFSASGTNYDFVRLNGMTAATTLLVQYANDVYIYNTAFGFSGGIVIRNTTTAELQDQLIYA